MSRATNACRGAMLSPWAVVPLFLSAILLGWAGLVSSAGAADAEIPLMDQAPVIDGAVDDLWSWATPQIGTIVTEGAAPTSPADCQILWKALSDATNLYVLVDVNDESLVQDSGSAWDDDRVSVYLDGDNSKDSATNASAKNDFQFNFRWNNGVVESPSEWYLGLTTGVTYAIAKTPTGYRLEILFPWATINSGKTPQEGQLIGFDVGIDDDDDGGSRDTQLAWHIPSSPPHDPRKWGTAELVIVKTDKASRPHPAHQATDVAPDVVLGWKPGQYAQTHDVYFGTNLDEVSAGGLLVSQSQDANTYDPAGLLTLGQTYYWRVDEVNATTGTIVRGDLWSFTVEPVAYPLTNITVTASSFSTGSPAENVVNGSGLTGALHSTDTKGMWLSNKTPQPNWIQFDFDRLYQLYEVWAWNHNSVYESILGFGVKTAAVEYSADGATWTKLGDFEFTQAAGAEDYAHDTTIAFGGVAAQSVRFAIADSWGGGAKAGLSEVRFYYVPTYARAPQPASGSTGVDPDVTLGWRSGRAAVQHQVFVGGDSAAVRDGTTPTATVTTASYALSGLQLSQTYYWKVNEVNAAAAPGIWAGSVWSFTTSDFITVDDFESYKDAAPNRIFDSWVDGWGTTGNGSQVGYTSAPFAEKVIVHGGIQSMPFTYDNTGNATSDATRTYAENQDWTKAGVKTLVIYFRGNTTNTTGQLFCTVNTSRVNYSGNTSALATAEWTQWNVELAALGANLKAVKSLTVGVSGTGKGQLFFDDFRLYKSAPAAP
jgi:hypothetical protein